MHTILLTGIHGVKRLSRKRKGLLELYQTTFNSSYLKTAIVLNKYLIENFWDKAQGGFYFTKINSELENFRLKDIYDGAIPSGNSIALLNLFKLGRITADTLLEDKAPEIVKTFSETVKKTPEAYTQFISSFDFIIGPSFEIVIIGDKNSNPTKKILKTINSIFVPNKVIVLKPPGAEESEITELAPYSQDTRMINEKPTIYLCSNFTCKSPTNEICDVVKLLT